MQKRRKICPLSMAGMPMPGQSFLALAKNMGDDTVISSKGNKKYEKVGKQLRDVCRQALYSTEFQMNFQSKKSAKPNLVTFVPGSLWNTYSPAGPARSPVMLIGKMPGVDETNGSRNFIGPSGNFLRQAFVDAGVPADRTKEFYVTNVLRFTSPDAKKGESTIPATWLKECEFLLQQELCIVQPKFILCLGDDAARVVLGRGIGTGNSEGRVFDLKIPVSAEDPTKVCEAKAMVMIHPARALRSPELTDRFNLGVRKFVQLVRTGEVSCEEKDLTQIVVSDAATLKKVLARVEKEVAEDRLIAVDAEWHGKHPGKRLRNPDGSDRPYLRTIQFSWHEKKSVVVRLRHAGGEIGFEPSPGAAIKLLRDFFKDKYVCGSFFNADLEWLVANGLDLRPNFRVPAKGLKNGTEAWERVLSGGMDIALAAHAVEETGQLGLECLAGRYTEAPRYDVVIEEEIKRYCKEKKISRKQLEGFGYIPDDMLELYGSWDVLVTYRIAKKLKKLLMKDTFGLDCRKPFWISMRATEAVLEINTTGVLVDREQFERIRASFERAAECLLKKIRDWACWPTLNISSPFQVRELMFGEEYNGKPFAQIEETGQSVPVRLRPEGAKTMGLTPILSTGRRQKQWAELVENEEEDDYTAGTGKSVLELAYQAENQYQEQIGWIRDFRFVQQALRYMFKGPVLDEETEKPLRDSTGNLVYHDGFAGELCDDNRVRPTILQTAETGRYKCYRPNLQALCVDGETEFLTDTGWIKAVELQETHKVAEFWPADESIDFVKPELIVQHFKGSMLHITTEKHIDLLVTPDHRCLFRSRRGDKAWFETKAFDFRTDCMYPQAGIYTGGSQNLDEDEVTFLCATQADGSYVTAGGISFCFMKKRKIDRLKSCLRRLNCKFSERVKEDGRTSFYIGKGTRLDLLAKSYMPNKQFGSWLLALDRDTLDCFKEEIFFWDGLWTRRTEFLSSIKNNADWVQILWTLSGWRAQIRESKCNREKKLYCVDTSVPHRRASYSLTSNFERREVDWDGLVYCVSVPSSFVVIRRNGRVSITGNSKKREADYVRILGDSYVAPVRSMLVASPGHVLVEADYVGAELYGAAIMSGDTKMIEDCQRNQLPENDPNFYDIHANISKLAFPNVVTCAPTKSAMKEIGVAHLRDVAKTVIFGVLYGRQAKAVAVACREMGNDVTEQQAQEIINTIFKTYPDLESFFAECANRALNPGWICGAFGRYRRFPASRDREVQGEQQRQAMNFPIQGMIADAVSRALDHLVRYREEVNQPDLYKIVLQIHDAIILEVPAKHVDVVYDTAFHLCMCKRVPIKPCFLDGTPQNRGPYYLGIDKAVFTRWGMKITEEECIALGLDPGKYAPKKG